MAGRWQAGSLALAASLGLREIFQLLRKLPHYSFLLFAVFLIHSFR